jgi:hypothetical protein
LRARNDVGEQQYTVRISTSAEPQGMRNIFWFLILFSR